MKPIHTQTYIFNIHKFHRRRIKFITRLRINEVRLYIFFKNEEQPTWRHFWLWVCIFINLNTWQQNPWKVGCTLSLLLYISKYKPVICVSMKMCFKEPHDCLLWYKQWHTHSQQLPALSDHIGRRVHLGLGCKVKDRVVRWRRGRVTHVPRMLPTQ